MAGVLLLVYCTVSVISKGRSGVRVRARLPGLSLAVRRFPPGVLEAAFSLCHPRGYAPLVTLFLRS